MEQVGLHLQQTAIARRSNAEDFDQFGRSSFNRYYYALFLIVRSMILEFNPTWDATHSSIPQMLTGSIEREIKQYRSNAQRLGQSDAILLCNRAISALAALAELMRTANTARVTADYNPNIKIVDESAARFSLGTTNITDAHSWATNARALTTTISRAWRLSRGGA